MPATRPIILSGLAVWLALAACKDPGPETTGDDLTDPQLPARGSRDIQAWLAAGYYQAWRCEPDRHPGRASSPHGLNRICNNEALVAAAAAGGALPVGAAAVKEIFEGDAIVSHAVSRKVTAGSGGSRWYWYEGGDDNVFANNQGADNCTTCHAHAETDYVFTIVP